MPSNQEHLKQFVFALTPKWFHFPHRGVSMVSPAIHFRNTLILFAQRVWQQCRIDEAMNMAAQVSFYFALSCFPFLLVLAAILGWIHRTPDSYAFWHWLTAYLPVSAQNTVLTIMFNLSKGFEGFLSFGLFLTIWSASTGFLSLMEALSHVYGAHDSRSYLKRRMLAIGATILAAIFVLACFAIWSAGHVMAAFVFHYTVYFAGKWKFARWGLTLAIILIGVDLLNYFLPAKRPPWRWIMPGSALTVLCFVLASGVLKLYVSYNHTMSRIYGALTGFIVIMLWIYLANLSVLLGAQTDAVLLQLQSERAAS